MDEETVKRRFLIYMGARLVGLVVFFTGVAIMYSNVLRQGGWPQLGAIVAVVGMLASMLLPHRIKRRWDRQ